MRVLRLTLDSPPARVGRPVVTIGNFDGVHLGHQKIVKRAIAAARARGEIAVVLTFDPHPVKLLHPAADFRCLKTLEQRLADLARLGVDAVAALRFDDELRRATPEEFATRVLRRLLRASEVLVGPAFRFGQRRAGDLARLIALGRELGFAAHAIPPLRRGGAPVSSTRIREAIAAGEVELAGRLLGGPLRIDGTVVRGRARGRSLGVPTANLDPMNELLPAAGVYATRVTHAGRRWRGATFVGEARTFGERNQVFETHLIGAPDRDLYGERLSIELIARIRGPVQFQSADDLVRQIHQDLEAARRKVRLSTGRKVAGRRSKVEGRRSKVEGRRSKVEGRRS